MTDYFIGGEMDSFDPSSGAPAEQTQAGTYDATFSRCSILAGDHSTWITTSAFAAPDTCYFHIYLGSTTASLPTGAIWELRAGSTGVFRLYYDGTGIQMQSKIAGVYTNVGTSHTGGATGYIDMYVTGNNASGTAKLFVADTLQVTATAVDLSAVTGITTMRIYSASGPVGAWCVSQAVVSDTSTVGRRILTRYPNGAGATSSWTNGYAQIDETTYDDADIIISGTANQVSTFTTTGPTLPANYVVSAVAVNFRAQNDGGTPANIEAVLRVNGTDYVGATKTLGVGFNANCTIWATNPDTAAAWANADIAALQPGVKSIT